MVVAGIRAPQRKGLPMTPISKALDASLSEAVLLNARRYGLSQENLTQFSELMNSIKGQKTAPAAPTDTASSESAAQDVPQTSYSDLIKDYVKQRMTTRMQISQQADARAQDAYAHYTTPNAQDFLLGGAGLQRQSSNDISNLLNMHFDFNTLQMLP